MAKDQIDDSYGAASPDEQQIKEQKEKVRRFRKRLQARETFLLPEVWDVVSARIMADAGFDLIGISSDALAWAHGLRKDERLSLESLAWIAQKITGGFAVPVKADLEGIAARTPE